MTALDFLHFLEQKYIPGADDFTVSMQVCEARQMRDQTSDVVVDFQEAPILDSGALSL